MTGFNLPPGCTTRHIDEAMGVDAQCEVCKRLAEDCICPECPTCSTHGDPKCYQDHGLTLSNAQLRSQVEYAIADLKDQIADHQHYLDWLDEQEHTQHDR